MQGISFAQQVTIDLGERSYPILIGSGLLDDPGAFEGSAAGTQALIVTNTTVAPLYADRLERVLARRHPQVRILALPDGEEHKNWETLNLIFDALLSSGADRKTTLYALGVSSAQAPVFKAVIVILIVTIQSPAVKAYFAKRAAVKNAMMNAGREAQA